MRPKLQELDSNRKADAERKILDFPYRIVNYILIWYLVVNFSIIVWGWILIAIFGAKNVQGLKNFWILHVITFLVFLFTVLLRHWRAKNKV